MKMRMNLAVALCAATIGAAAVPTAGIAAVYFDVGPPPARVEPVPAPRAGYVWVPGYWDARGHRHVWTRGHWVRERRGYAWHEPRWVQRESRWYLERGRWDRADRQR